MDFLAEAKKIEPEIIRTRRALHQHPELSYHEVWTSKFVSDRLEALGIHVRRGVGGNGVVGTLKGGVDGKVVALRADMDALPITEAADVGFRSKIDGVMHACGHDTHMAMLLGAAEILARAQAELHGTVKFLFQPAEEHGGRGGALPMIEDGAMLDPKVDYVFGLHIDGDRKAGEFGVRGGPVMAAPDTFKIRIEGRGGHGSAPHKTIDPVYIAANVILGLQGISSRMMDPVRPFVITVGSVHAGTKENIIPDYAELEGTIRTLDEATRKSAKRKVAGVVGGLCRSFGGSAHVEFEADAYPVTVNDPKTTERAVKVLQRIRGTRVKRMEPILGGEDFSRFLQKSPGTFYFLGAANPAKGCVYPNHSSKFKADEDVLKYGAASLAMLAFEFGSQGTPR
ncbi:MAG: amidohydrolase [Nitrososphaerota archaeon]|nr:amidohydrolase [Nitrososphaerota archaeon]MDG6937841.1 amidohydrolase [Nitrososphaerota archaeon]MDG6952839.1 amidohydrolase [Nitrososphaerota archaeon]MDG6955987.1 amidohydrolase [Nitrososphaerota archaeon]MDG6959629.1 amidohydrolase [Nitrososphaerota archaeon]